MIKFFSFQGFEGGTIHKTERSLDHQNTDESGNRNNTSQHYKKLMKNTLNILLNGENTISSKIWKKTASSHFLHSLLA